MGTRETITETLHDMVLRMPYAKITVTELCCEAHISRKAFYDHFENKEDVLEQLFTERVIKPISDLNKILPLADLANMELMLNEHLYRRIIDDRAFWYRLVRPMKGSDDTFLRVATRSIYRLNEDVLARFSNALPAWKHEYTAYFFSSSQAMLLQKWICDDMAVDAHDLAEFYNEITSSFWHTFRPKTDCG